MVLITILRDGVLYNKLIGKPISALIEGLLLGICIGLIIELPLFLLFWWW